MHDLQLPSRDAFAANVNTTFEVVVSEEQTLPITLVEISEIKQTSRTERFSILFEGPLDYYFSQGMYTMVHEKLGTLNLFIVPVFREESCFVYEALFNRLLDRNRTSEGE